MYFVILKLILFYLYDYVESMQGAHHYYEPSLKRQKITDISDNKKPGIFAEFKNINYRTCIISKLII